MTIDVAVNCGRKAFSGNSLDMREDFSDFGRCYLFAVIIDRLEMGPNGQ